jgi:hypothetical protein
VKTAHKQIYRDNQTILANTRPTKPSRYDQARLAATPRKRHNTRWPVTPPNWLAMIREWQPYIVFEMITYTVDAHTHAEQEIARAVNVAATAAANVAANAARSVGRRVVFTPTAQTSIQEEPKEPSGQPVTYHPVSSAHPKRWAAASAKFTMRVTRAGEGVDDTEGDEAYTEITNLRGHFRVPSSPLSSRFSTTSASKDDVEVPVEVTNERGRFCVPSSPLSSKSDSTTASNRKRKAQNELIAQRPTLRRRVLDSQSSCMALFDQPASSVHFEPEYETRRRFSLDNARRTDRQVQMTAFKKVRAWFGLGKRHRNDEEDMEEQGRRDGSPRTRRRLTLDVDVGTNPDIFGQLALPAPNDKALPFTTLENEIKNNEKSAAENNTDDSATNLLDDTANRARRDPSPWSVPSEFSMAREAVFPSADVDLDTSVPSIPKRAGIDWSTITNVDDMIRDHLDRKAALVFGKDDYGNTVSSDGDDTELFQEHILEHIKTAFEPEEDEGMARGDLDVDRPAPAPPATETVMTDSPVADMHTLDSATPNAATPHMPTATDAILRTGYDPEMVDVPIPSIERDDKVNMFIAEEHAAASQPAGFPDDDSEASTVPALSDVSKSDVESTDVEPATRINAPGYGEPAAIPQPAEFSDDDSEASTVPALSDVSKSDVENTDVEPAAELQTEDVHDADSSEDSRFEMLHIFVRRAQMKGKQTPPKSIFPHSPTSKTNTSTLLNSHRQPLGQRDSNISPITNKLNVSGSPGKKRKLKEVEDAPLDMKRTTRLVKPDLDDTIPQPLRKRRRKGGEDDSTDEIFNPEMVLSQSLTKKGSSSMTAPRRSKRVVTTPPIERRAPPHFPIRLPGSFDADMPSVSTAGLMQKKTEKDLDKLTKTNTRLNQGAALMPPARLAGLSLPAVGDDPFLSSPDNASKPRASRPGKTVRWDCPLACFQGGEIAHPTATTAGSDLPLVRPPPPPADLFVNPRGVLEKVKTLRPRPSPRATASTAGSDLPFVRPPPPPADLFVNPRGDSEKMKALRPRPSRLPAAVAKPTKTELKTPKTPKTSKTKAGATPSRITPTPTRRSSAVGARLATPPAKRRGSTKK